MRSALCKKGSANKKRFRLLGITIHAPSSSRCPPPFRVDFLLPHGRAAPLAAQLTRTHLRLSDFAQGLGHPRPQHHLPALPLNHVLQNFERKSLRTALAMAQIRWLPLIPRLRVQLHWVDMETGEIHRKQLRRQALMEFFANRQPGIVAMETCSGAHYWIRELRKLGHEIRLIAAQFVHPFVKTLGKVRGYPHQPLHSTGRAVPHPAVQVERWIDLVRRWSLHQPPHRRARPPFVQVF